MLDCFIVVRCLWRLCTSVTRLLILCSAFTAEQYQQHQQQLALMQQQQLAQTQQQQANRSSTTAAPQVRGWCLTTIPHGFPPELGSNYQVLS